MGAAVTASPWLIPALMGGMGAVGSALGGGAQGQLKGYGVGSAPPTRMSLDPTLLGQVLAPIEQVMGIAAGRARQPVTLPGAFAQPNPMYSGGGLPMPIGTTGVDPALQQPHLMGLQGVNIGKGPLSREYRQYGGVGKKAAWGTVSQGDPQMPEVGGGMPQLQAALELLGVHRDPMGNLSSGGTDLFTGAGNGGGNGAGNGGGNGTGDSAYRCDPVTERWDENLQTCVPIVFDDPTDTPESDQGGAIDYDDEGYPLPQSGFHQSNQTASSNCADLEVERQAQCVAEGGRWIPGSPVSGSGGRPCGGYCQ